MTDNVETKKAVEKRSIRTADFRHDDAMAAAIKGERTLLGQIVGVVFDAKKKVSQNPDGTSRESTLLQGQFEAVAFKTGEILKSGSCYMPAYFAEALASQIAKSEGGVMFAVEIYMEKAERAGGVPYQYSVSNLIEPEPNDPLEMLKRRVGAKLKLPALAAPNAAPAQIENKSEETAEKAAKKSKAA